MKILIVGSGKMGSVMAWDLCRYRDVETIGLADTCQSSLDATRNRVKDDRIRPHLLKQGDRQQLIEIMKGYDVGLGALPFPYQSNELVEDAVTAGLDLVEIHGEYQRRPNESFTKGLSIPEGMSAVEYGEQLHQKAVEKDILILACMGFAPGLSNLTLGHGIRMMDTAESAIARVGGIPAKEVAGKYPMNYMVTWAWNQTIDCAMNKIRVTKDGTMQDVDAMSDYEKFCFDKCGKNYDMEAFITPGMESLVYTRPDLKNCYEKTIRWPGYYDAMNFLGKCGLFDLEPVEINGVSMIPRYTVGSIMEPKLLRKDNDPDACLMWNTVIGTRDGKPSRRDYHMWVDADSKNAISSMGVATAFPAAVSAVMLGRKAFDAKGIVATEDVFDTKLYHEFVGELESKGIVIEETVS